MLRAVATNDDFSLLIKVNEARQPAAGERFAHLSDVVGKAPGAKAEIGHRIESNERFLIRRLAAAPRAGFKQRGSSKGLVFCRGLIAAFGRAGLRFAGQDLDAVVFAGLKSFEARAFLIALRKRIFGVFDGVVLWLVLL